MAAEVDATPLRIPLVGNTLAAHCAITYTLCVMYGLVLGDASIHKTVFEAILPGFTWITWPSFFLGLVEIVVYGWYAGGLFALLYNSFGAFRR